MSGPEIRMTLISLSRPKPGDVITTVEMRDGSLFAYVEPGRRFYARHFIAQPWSLFKWSVRIGCHDLKRMICGQPRRPIETVATALERTPDA